MLTIAFLHFSSAFLRCDSMSAKNSFEAIFSKQRTEYVELTTTYRSTYEIAMYAQKFMRKGTLQPIARHGQAPREMTYITVEQMVEYIRDPWTCFPQCASQAPCSSAEV